VSFEELNKKYILMIDKPTGMSYVRFKIQFDVTAGGTLHYLVLADMFGNM
jgi:hypothetical protein